ncbi:hypothetical protein KNJ79_05320 [Sphingopyxis indica]|uniref:hypothetical protein n=1 Tax=Sphingopyxis indica TaxID=436663 RepID=UPI002938D187|nr:hypothetical protein [Sphingopyxis indica]WOF44353.1 hypothetical protein KNJ79_05320 [Sphingopyxis indica]
MALSDSIAQILLPKGKGTKGGKGFTPTYNPRDVKVAVPGYQQHLDDLLTSRIANDSRTLLNTLINHDPDVSSAVHSYLTIAGSADLVIAAYDQDGNIDVDATKTARRILENLTTTNDYTVGFSDKPILSTLLDDLRYMILLRGMNAAELVLDKSYVPTEFRLIDPVSLEWREAKPGVFSPIQKPSGSNTEIDLNIPTFFTSKFHQNPTSIYTFSTFVSAINTITARATVINELYKIMRIVGYPRMDVSILQDVIERNAPPNIKDNPTEMRNWVSRELTSIQSTIAGLSARDAFVHSDAVKAEIINDKNPSAGLQIERVIDILDNQNQAALKVMPAVVGKSSNGQVASTEARLFALGADALNRSIAALFSKTLTFAVRLAGSESRVAARFRPVELRPVLELEPQLTMRASRLRNELSLGTITDEEYHLEMFGRLPRAGAPVLSGTGFMNPADASVSVNAEDVSPNDDPLGRGLTAPGSESAKSNEVDQGG